MGSALKSGLSLRALDGWATNLGTGVGAVVLQPDTVH
jgi:hypothetical protein